MDRIRGLLIGTAVGGGSRGCHLRSLSWIRALAARVHERSAPLRLAWPLVPVRNALFPAIALGTGLRRLLPPY